MQKALLAPLASLFLVLGLSGCQEESNSVGTVTAVRITTSVNVVAEEGGSPVIGAAVGGLLTGSVTGAVIGAAVGNGRDHIKIQGEILAVRVLVKLPDGMMLSFSPSHYSSNYSSNKKLLSTFRAGDKVKIQRKWGSWCLLEMKGETGTVLPD